MHVIRRYIGVAAWLAYLLTTTYSSPPASEAAALLHERGCLLLPLVSASYYILSFIVTAVLQTVRLVLPALHSPETLDL